MRSEMTFRRKLNAHVRLVTTGFGNAMREYFSVRTRAAMRIIGTGMEVAVWGVLGLLMANSIVEQSLQDYYKVSTMVEFMLSGLIINRLVDMAQLFNPWFFRMAYKTYHNRPFNIWVVALAKNLDQMFFWRFIGLITYIVFATFVFKVNLNYASVGFWVVILLGALFRFGLNLFTAGWTVLTKGEQDPVNWFYNTTSRLFTGELIPITFLSTLPIVGPYLRYISMVHPKTYVQTLGRKTAIGGAKLPEIIPKLTVPLIAAIFFLILGYFTLKVAIKRAKREGIMKWG